MSLQQSLDTIIANLTEAKADADKADRGNKSAGTRARKAAQEATVALKKFRQDVLAARED
jgi:hypothetical protein